MKSKAYFAYYYGHLEPSQVPHGPFSNYSLLAYPLLVCAWPGRFLPQLQSPILFRYETYLANIPNEEGKAEGGDPLV